MSVSFSDYRDIDQQELEKHFDIGEFTEGDVNSRQTKNIATYNGDKLRFRSPWMFSRFGWGGKYETLTVQSSSKGKFPLDNNSDKKSFRRFLNNLGEIIEKRVMEQPNPNNLNVSLTKQFSYDSDYGYYKYYFNIPKKHIDADGEFEGKVFTSTDTTDPELNPSSIKSISPNSYVEVIGYIGKITQTKNCIRFNIVIENIHWMPGNAFLEKTEEEKISNSSNLFMNVPSIKKKRKIAVNVDYNNEDQDQDEDIEDLSATSKKVKS